MRILFLTPIPFWHPGTLELMDGLKANHFTLVALDIWSFKFFDQDKNVSSLIPKKLTGIFAKIYMRLYRKKMLKKQIQGYDVVDIHWCGHYYSKYMKVLKNENVKIIATLFGSDFLRTSLQEKKIQSKIFHLSDKIVMGINMQEEFTKYFSAYSGKIVHNQYGSARLELIPELNTPDHKKRVRALYSIPDEKIVVTLGYNAKAVQQHHLFLDQINNAPKSLKERLFLLIPMTYGDGEKYNTHLKSLLNKTEIEYLCLQNHLSDKEMAETKIISDITLNFQTTDALSSSIKEAFVAKNVLLVGDWLPYNLYQEMGLFYLTTPPDLILRKFIDIIENLDFLKEKCNHNPEIIIKFANWKAILPLFIKTYKEVIDGKSE